MENDQLKVDLVKKLEQAAKEFSDQKESYNKEIEDLKSLLAKASQTNNRVPQIEIHRLDSYN